MPTLCSEEIHPSIIPIVLFGAFMGRTQSYKVKVKAPLNPAPCHTLDVGKQGIACKLQPSRVPCSDGPNQGWEF